MISSHSRLLWLHQRTSRSTIRTVWFTDGTATSCGSTGRSLQRVTSGQWRTQRKRCVTVVSYFEASVFFTNDMLCRKATRALAASSLICMRPIRPLLLDGHHPDICHPGTCHPTFKKPHPKVRVSVSQLATRPLVCLSEDCYTDLALLQ